MTVVDTIKQISTQALDRLIGHNPLPDMPVEVELAIVAWNNLTENYDKFADDLADTTVEEICLKIEPLMKALTEQFQRKTR